MGNTIEPPEPDRVTFHTLPRAEVQRQAHLEKRRLDRRAQLIETLRWCLGIAGLIAGGLNAWAWLFGLWTGLGYYTILALIPSLLFHW